MAVQTTTTTQVPWAAQQPFLTQGFNEAQRLYGLGGPQYYPDSTVSRYGPDTQQALSMFTNQATAGTPVAGAANDLVTNTLQGGYLPTGAPGASGNPYLDSMYQSAADQTTRAYQESTAPSIAAQYANAGRTGSYLAGNAQDQARDTLSRNLSGMGANLYGGAYENERQRQMQAAQLAPQTADLSYLDANQLLNVGNMRDIKGQEQLTDAVNRWQYNQQQPWDTLGRYSSLIQGNYGGQGTMTQPLYNNDTAQNVGLGLTAAGVFGDIGGWDWLKGLF